MCKVFVNRVYFKSNRRIFSVELNGVTVNAVIYNLLSSEELYRCILFVCVVDDLIEMNTTYQEIKRSLNIGLSFQLLFLM